MEDRMIARKAGTGDIVRKGLIMILSQVPGVTRTFEGIHDLATNPLAVFFELADSHPDKARPLYYSLGYSLTVKREKQYEALDILEIRAHAHETEASREFMGRFQDAIIELFPGVEPLRPELLDTSSAKRIYRWWLPIADVIGLATCGNEG